MPAALAGAPVVGDAVVPPAGFALLAGAFASLAGALVAVAAVAGLDVVAPVVLAAPAPLVFAGSAVGAAPVFPDDAAVAGFCGGAAAAFVVVAFVAAGADVLVAAAGACFFALAFLMLSARRLSARMLSVFALVRTAALCAGSGEPINSSTKPARSACFKSLAVRRMDAWGKANGLGLHAHFVSRLHHCGRALYCFDDGIAPLSLGGTAGTGGVVESVFFTVAGGFGLGFGFCTTGSGLVTGTAESLVC